ncbi:protein of unknown function [Devosia sp. YR412]|nr:DUF4258 domain-containing protein [Devosia sp. YR412]SEP82124.1 protein of unknown function [Devosia sp. YR412]
MNGLNLSAHATTRMHQRGIRSEVVEALLTYGRCERSRGADVYFVDRRTRERVREEIGGKRFARIEKSLDAYLVVGEDGTLITAARSLRRFRRQ